jgi:hypothetical protein
MSDDPTNDSAAKRRQSALSKELGKEMGLSDEKAADWLWAKYPRSLIEFRMDRPPNPRPADWKSVHGPKARVYATYMRYSWCWPICLRYAVVTDERDEIRREEKDPYRPLVLSEEAVAQILGLTQQRVSAVVLDLVADKLIRVERAPNRQHSMAVYLEASPLLSEEERRDKSTLVATGLAGPRLEPVVQRRFLNLLKQLGEDDAVISVPPDGSNGNAPQLVRVGDYRTLVWRELLDNRTAFLTALKSLRYSERSAYGVLSTRVRNLIDQTQSSESYIHSSSSVGADAGPDASQPTDRPAASPVSTYTEATTTTAPKDARFFELTTRLFTTAGKGAPTPKQLGTAWKLIPADAELEEWETFLLKVEKGSKTSRMARAEHAGVLVSVAAEFATEWIGQRAERESQRFGVRPRVEHEDTRQEKIRRLQGAIEDAQRIVDDKAKYSPDERSKQQARVQKFRDELAALNGKADAAGGGA